MGSYIDLHIHTTASDGTFTPAQVVSLAAESGICVIAITDHDTIEGNEEAIIEGKKLGIKVIPGVEISCSHTLGETHLLGYYINWRSRSLGDMLSLLRGFRDKRNPQIVKKLRYLGIDITYEEVKMAAGGGCIGRPHIAQVLKEKGYAFSNQDAFDRYLKKGGAAYVPKELISIKEAIDIIHDADGLAVVAHPCQYRFINTYYGLQRFIKELVDDGIDGLEAYYNAHTKEDVRILIDLARTYNLLLTGGTDFHGDVKPGIELGVGMGDMEIPYELFIEMEEAKKKRIVTTSL